MKPIYSTLSNIFICLLFINIGYLQISHATQCLASLSTTACEHHTLQLHCPNNGNIRITYALYGRKDGTTCPHSAVSDTNCEAVGAIDKVLASCNGQNSCSVLASNSVFGDPCVGTYKYLTVEYDCYESAPSSSPTATACEHYDLSLKCPDNSCIKVTSALYGRKDGTTCPHSSISDTNCEAAGALAIVAASCNNENMCNVLASNSIFGDPCVGTYKYLTVDYDCFEIPPIASLLGTACEHYTLQLQCPKNSSIRVTEALYGRKDSTTCPHTAVSDTNCAAKGALNIVATQCDGGSSCSILASNSVFGDPCVGTYKYLKVWYDCFKN